MAQRFDADQVWSAILDFIREESADTAAYLENNATMRLDEEQQEVILAGHRGLYDFLSKNRLQKQLINQACEHVLGWDRGAHYEWLDVEDLLSPSGYAFLVAMAEHDDAGDEPAVEAEPEERQASPFDSLRIMWSDGSERWSHRDLADLFGYARPDNMAEAMERTRESLKVNGQDPLHHMLPWKQMIGTGKGAKREVEVIYLTRFACYLLAMNGNSSRPAVAQAQAYFAVQTRKQELAEQFIDDARRVKMRDVIADHNVQLAAAARDAGVITARDFAIFQNYGYMGLYNGMRSADIKRRKGLGEKDTPLDRMGFDELAAHFFRVSQTEQRLRREKTQGRDQANDVHYQVGKKVRQTISELGGTMPEDMPVVDHIKEARKRVKGKDLDAVPLFDIQEP